ALAGIVGGQGQLPVGEAVVQLLQVVQCGIGGGDHVAPAVVPPGLLQAVVAAGGRNELPDARSPSGRVGERLVGALDHRQQRQLHRHAALFELLDDVVQIRRRAVGDPVYVF